jgi:hypothetical protein
VTFTGALRRWRAPLGAAALLVWNLAIVARLLRMEWSAYNGSVEGSFIALARIMAKYPGQWSWWPFWNGGMPFECAYLPFSHWLVAGFSLLTGVSAPRSFHIVSAVVYALAAPAVFWMALAISRKFGASFFAAWAYSCVSISAVLPRVAADMHGALNLRRLHVLAFYGEAPHTTAMALLPVAMVCFHRALTTGAVKWKILAGALAAFVVLSNAFGAVALSAALLAWLLAFPRRPWWKAPLTVAAIGAASFCWVTPWLSPAMFRALWASTPAVGPGFGYRPATWIALAVFSAGLALLWFLLRRFRAPDWLRFFLLFGYIPTGIVLAGYFGNVNLIPQPLRYQVEMDLALLLAVAFGAAALVDKLPRRARIAVAAVLAIALTAQSRQALHYAGRFLNAGDPARLGEYKIAKWMDANLPGERAFIGGSSALLYNAITGNPQFKGGHDQHAVNQFIAAVDYSLYSDEGTEDRGGAWYSTFWLKAFGCRAVSVSGPGSNDYYKPYNHPRKFEGALPVLWREDDNTIYEVPGRSRSLAHVMPAAAVPARRPIHAVDVGPVEAYVAALDDPRYPAAAFDWKSLSEAVIHATVAPGQVVAAQVTYAKGWEAWANGRRQRVRGDAIGQTVIEPDCTGPCEITLRYTGGVETTIARALSLAAMLFAAGCAWRARRSQAV